MMNGLYTFQPFPSGHMLTLHGLSYVLSWFGTSEDFGRETFSQEEQQAWLILQCSDIICWKSLRDIVCMFYVHYKSSIQACHTCNHYNSFQKCLFNFILLLFESITWLSLKTLWWDKNCRLPVKDFAGWTFCGGVTLYLSKNRLATMQKCHKWWI